MKTPNEVVVGSSLIGLGLALFAIGVVSGTVLRHAIQSLPGWIALAGLVLGKAWARQAASPIFRIWGVIILAIWLSITGILRIIPGSFSAGEVILTVIVAAFCLVGGYYSAESTPGDAKRTRYPVGVGFTVFQILAIVLGMIGPFAHD